VVDIKTKRNFSSLLLLLLFLLLLLLLLWSPLYEVPTHDVRK